MSRFLSALRFGAVYLGIWIPVCAGYAALIYFQSPSRSLSGAANGSLFSCGLAALLGLIIWPISTRLADRGAAGKHILGWHLLMAATFTAAWTAFNAYSIARYAPAELSYFMTRVIGWHAYSGLLVFGTIAGLAHMNETNRRARREREAAERAEALRWRAELAALRSQLNPHFLFNTLHSISAMVRSDPSGAELALEQLGGLLRHVLDLSGREHDAISLGEEWDLICRQLDLERLRFGDRLQVASSLDDDALDCAVPMLIVQPLVENAVRHGIAPREGGGTVTVRAHVEGDQLVVEVSDDGVGCTMDELRSGSGIGVRSITQRLAATYGDRASLAFTAAPNHGVQAIVTMPVSIAPTRPAPLAMTHDEAAACAS